MAKNRQKHPIAFGAFGGQWRRQLGLSLSGVAIAGTIFLGLAYLGLKIYPLYYERFLVIQVMDTLAADRKAVRSNEAQLRFRFLRLAGLNGVTVIKQANIHEHFNVVEPRKKGQPRLLIVTYEARSPLFGDLDLLLKFNQERMLGEEGG